MLPQRYSKLLKETQGNVDESPKNRIQNNNRFSVLFLGSHKVFLIRWCGPVFCHVGSLICQATAAADVDVVVQDYHYFCSSGAWESMLLACHPSTKRLWGCQIQ